MAVTNPYYEFTPSFVLNTKVRASEMNTQFAALQTAFDFLPGDNSALTTGTATFAPESGTGNAYVVTMPDTRTSNQDGDEVIFFATHANTGAATLNVDSIGAVTLTDRTGAALTSGDIVSGRLYMATYDASNTRFVLDVTTNVVTNVVDKVQGTSTDNPASPGTFNANFGFENASAASLATMGFNTDIDFTVKNIVAGGSVILQAPSGNYYIRSAGNLDTQRRMLHWTHLDGTVRGQMGYNTSGGLEIRNEVHDGAFFITTEDASGFVRSVINFDPGGGAGSGGQLLLYGEDNNSMAQTMTAATGGMEVNNTQTGGGFERVLTQSDTARTSTTTELADITDAINTAAEKVAGFMVFNVTTSKPVWAVGNTDGAVWVDATGATAHTPV